MAFVLFHVDCVCTHLCLIPDSAGIADRENPEIVGFSLGQFCAGICRSALDGFDQLVTAALSRRRPIDRIVIRLARCFPADGYFARCTLCARDLDTSGDFRPARNSGVDAFICRTAYGLLTNYLIIVCLVRSC